MNTQAFPVFVEPTQQEKMSGRGPVHYLGMTLRDYFAAKAMAVVPEQSSFNMKDGESNEQYIARRAYEYADAMLKARKA